MAAPRHRPRRGLPFVLSVFFASVAALVLAGCASTRGLAPEEHAIEADSLASSRSLGPQALSDAAFPAQDWWTALGDPQLDTLIREALQDSPSLAAADARVRQAQAQAGLADAARKPTLGASAQETAVQLPETLAPAPLGGDLQASTVLMLDFKWAPDLWGGKRAKYEAAVGQARAAQIDAQAARLALSSNVARSYIAFAQAHEMLDVAQREQARASHLRDLARQRVEAGLDNQLQLRQSESTIAAARQQAQSAQQQIDALRNALAALLGKGPDRGLDITRPHLLDAPSPAVPAVLPSELLGHRADVVAARWRVEAASRGIDASKAAFKPSINLNALVGLASAGLSDLFSGDALLGFGGPAISLPIFDGGGLRSQLAKSDADYDLAVAGYNQSLVAALHEVTDAVQAARALDAQIASATQARDAAQSALQLADTRYQAGIGTQLDVLSAQRPLLQLEQQLAALRAQRYAATVDLDRALGGGLVLAGPDAAPESDSNPDLAGAPTP
ncbi:efflux transporter outer membrane subunit [Luteimonas sp. 22616]|uniref:efflux transporter outer membrane subunit n=1 Tax=Luteimonas sp. 22616 TaxID=3453951 RepID=UPI003F84C7A0